MYFLCAYFFRSISIANMAPITMIATNKAAVAGIKYVSAADDDVIGAVVDVLVEGVSTAKLVSAEDG